MGKGIWIKNLFRKMIEKQISILDSTQLFLARFRRKPINLKVFGLEFYEVDHVLWSIMMDIFVNDVYTPPGFEIDQNDVVVDIGAHQGVFSAYAAKRTREIIKSYEPNTLNYSRLCAFVRRNHLDHVEPYHYAIAGGSGERYLSQSKTTSTHFLIQRDDISISEGQQLEKIQTESLDKILAEMDHVDLLKIDCEGAELEIFLSASVGTLGKIKRISAEIHYALDDPRLKEMVEKLAMVFPSIDIKKIPGTNLAYLYAKNIP